MSKLKPISAGVYTGLGNVVQPGQYSLFTDRANIPSELSGFAYPAADRFYGVLAIASSSSQSPPSIGGVQPKAGESVFSVNVLRYDPGHRGRNDPHLNVDRTLSFQGQDGQAYRVSFDKHPTHFQQLSNDTGLAPVLKHVGVPVRPSGPLSDLSSGAGWQTFSTSFPRRG